jgi:hypothetical protein
MKLRAAISLAITRAVEQRGSWEVVVGGGYERWANITAAVDGSLELVVPVEWVRRGLLRQSRRQVDPAAMQLLGFRVEAYVWVKPIRAYAGAGAEARATLERVFTELLDASLEDDSTCEEDYPGVVPGRPASPPDASHAEHIRASLALFDFDPDGDICIHAGLPSCLYLQLALEPGRRVTVDVTCGDDERPEIPGFEPSPEVESGVRASFDLKEVPAVGARLLHERLSVDPTDPLFVELGSERLAQE